MQPHRDLDVVPYSSSLIYSKADPLVKQKYKKSVSVSMLSDNVHSRDVQPSPVCRVQGMEVIQCVNQEVQAKSKQQQCQTLVHTVFDDRPVCSDKQCQETSKVHLQPVQPAKKKSNYMWLAKPASLQSASKQKNPRRQKYMCADKKCQASKCYKKVYKNCQTTNMQPVESHVDMQSKEPAMQASFKKKHVPLCKDKNYQSTRCYRKKSPVRRMYGYDKNCQEIPNVQMRPKKPISNIQSVTKSSIPIRKQVNHKKCLCHGKNCQSARKYSKKCEYT